MRFSRSANSIFWLRKYARLFAAVSLAFIKRLNSGVNSFEQPPISQIKSSPSPFFESTTLLAPRQLRRCVVHCVEKLVVGNFDQFLILHDHEKFLWAGRVIGHQQQRTMIQGAID